MTNFYHNNTIHGYQLPIKFLPQCNLRWCRLKAARLNKVVLAQTSQKQLNIYKQVISPSNNVFLYIEYLGILIRKTIDQEVKAACLPSSKVRKVVPKNFRVSVPGRLLFIQSIGIFRTFNIIKLRTTNLKTGSKVTTLNT